MELGKSSYPQEYMVLLEEENGVINGSFMINGSSSSDSATIFTDMLPLGMKIAGTAHSHPRLPGDPERLDLLRPSERDVQTFGMMGQVHIIVTNPFDENSWKAFDKKGSPVILEVVES